MVEAFPTPGPQIPGWDGVCGGGRVYHLWVDFESLTPYVWQAFLRLFVYITDAIDVR